MGNDQPPVQEAASNLLQAAAETPNQVWSKVGEIPGAEKLAEAGKQWTGESGGYEAGAFRVTSQPEGPLTSEPD